MNMKSIWLQKNENPERNLNQLKAKGERAYQFLLMLICFSSTIDDSSEKVTSDGNKSKKARAEIDDEPLNTASSSDKKKRLV